MNHDYYDFNDYFTLFEEQDRAQYIRKLERENDILSSMVHKNKDGDVGTRDEVRNLKERVKTLEYEARQLHVENRRLRKTLKELGLILIEYRQNRTEW